MASLGDAQRAASRLPGVVEATDSFGFSVPHKGRVNNFLGMWRERIDPKKARVPNPGVLVLVVESLSAKETLISSEPTRFFTEPHYDGYAAILVRISEVTPDELEDLIVEAWRSLAPVELVTEFDQRNT